MSQLQLLVLWETQSLSRIREQLGKNGSYDEVSGEEAQQTLEELQRTDAFLGRKNSGGNVVVLKRANGRREAYITPTPRTTTMLIDEARREAQTSQVATAETRITTSAEADDPVFGPPGPDTEDDLSSFDDGEDSAEFDDEEKDGGESGSEDAAGDLSEENDEEHRGRSKLVAAGARRRSPSRDRRAW